MNSRLASQLFRLAFRLWKMLVQIVKMINDLFTIWSHHRYTTVTSLYLLVVEENSEDIQFFSTYIYIYVIMYMSTMDK